MIIAQYLESGTFVCGEEEVYNAGINRGDDAIILTIDEYYDLLVRAKMSEQS